MNYRPYPGLSDSVPSNLLRQELKGHPAAQETVGQRIRRLRKQAGLTQAQLAIRVLGQQSAQPSVSRWEKDDDLPSQQHMQKLASVFGTTESELHYGPENDALNIAARTQSVPVVGYVGAGDKVFPIDDYPVGYGLEEVEIPFQSQRPVIAVRVRGDSMRPMLLDNWLLFYTRDYDGVPDDCLNKLCIVKVGEDGPTLIKELRRGTRRGRFNLLSTNASPIEDVPLDWAARVLFIQPV